jgi:AcrR family transcriptional regulator
MISKRCVSHRARCFVGFPSAGRKGVSAVEKENQRVRLTKRLLRDTLFALLKEKPVNKLTVTEICAAAELNRSTFYQYYADPYALLEDAERDLIAQTDEYVARICADRGDVQYLTALLTFVREKKDVFFALFSRNADRDFEQKIMDSILNSIRAQIPFFADTAPRSSYIYQFLLMGNLAIMQQWIGRGCDLSVGEVAALTLRLSNAVMDASAGR